MTDLVTNLQVINLDNIPDDAPIMATIDTGRLMMSKAQLFARLGRRRGKKADKPVIGRATRIKSDSK